MFNLEQFSFSPDEFTGRVRLFPLPNLVLFPHVLQPLHVFEPRYRALLSDALEDDRLMGLVLLQPGWEAHYDERPPVSTMACLAKIATHQPLDDGRSNMLLVGLRRIEIVRELPASTPYRVVEAELRDDIYPAASAADRPAAQKKLLDHFRRSLPGSPAVREQMQQLLAAEVPLGVLTDIVAYTVDMDLARRQALLEELNVDRRAALLLDILAAEADESGSTRRQFPPETSLN